MSWNQLSGAAKIECFLYGVFALVGFVGTQWALLDGVLAGRMSGSQVWYDLTANSTVVFMAIDLFVVFLVAMTFMVVEGRRLRVRWWPLYLLLSAAIGISFGFPLFLIARRLRISGREESA
jgi:hypothetical protein